MSLRTLKNRGSLLNPDNSTAYASVPAVPGKGPLTKGDGTVIPSGSFAWTPYSGNPILSALAGSATDGNAYMEVWHDGQVFHAWTTVDGSPAAGPGIYEYISTDGLTGWTANPANPILTKGAGGSPDAFFVGVPTVWAESGTVYMLYRGMPTSATSGICLATAAVPTPASFVGAFTKYGSNPVHNGSGANSFVSSVIEPGPGRCIKVGSTYYLFVSGLFGNTRSIGVLSATDPHGPWSWASTTANANDPIWTEGSLCNSVWTDGVFYYALVCHYRSYNAKMVFQLWRSPDVTFPYSNREFLGVVRDLQRSGWESGALDTPTVFCDTIQRNSFRATGNMPRLYYSGQDLATTSFLPGVLIPALVSHPVPFDRKPVSVVGQWQLVNVPQSLSGAQISLNGTSVQFFTLAQSASVVSVAVYASKPITTGSMTIYVTDASGSRTPFTGGTSFSATLSAGNQSVQASQVEGLFHFGAGSAIGIQITSSADLAPADIAVGISVGVLSNYGA